MNNSMQEVFDLTDIFLHIPCEKINRKSTLCIEKNTTFYYHKSRNRIEFGDEAKYLEFDPEHLISKKPMQIDVLVKNEKHVKLKKNIGRVFRQYNIIEYKSPEDDLDIDDFYKTYAYACLYKSDAEAVDLIPADELTITFVCYHYPRNMLRKLEQDRKFSVERRTAAYTTSSGMPSRYSLS